MTLLNIEALWTSSGSFSAVSAAVPSPGPITVTAFLRSGTIPSSKAALFQTASGKEPAQQLRTTSGTTSSTRPQPARYAALPAISGEDGRLFFWALEE